MVPIDNKNIIIVIAAVNPSNGNFVAIHKPKTNIIIETIKNEYGSLEADKRI